MTEPQFELNPAIIDDLIEVLGGGFFELMEDQITSSNEYLDDLKGIFEKGEDSALAARRAHAMKSSTGQVGLHGIHRLTKKLEYQCKEDADAGKPISDEAKAIFSELTEFYTPAVRHLRDYSVAKREQLKD